MNFSCISVCLDVPSFTRKLFCAYLDDLLTFCTACCVSIAGVFHAWISDRLAHDDAAERSSPAACALSIQIPYTFVRSHSPSLRVCLPFQPLRPPLTFVQPRSAHSTIHNIFMQISLCAAPIRRFRAASDSVTSTLTLTYYACRSVQLHFT